MSVCLIIEKVPHESAANLTYKRTKQFIAHIKPFSKKIHVVLGGVITKTLQSLPVAKFYYVPYHTVAKRGFQYILAHVLYLICAFFKTCKAIRQNKEIKIVINIGAHWSSGLIALLAGKFMQRHVVLRVIGSVKTPLAFFKADTKIRNINLLTSVTRKILLLIEDIVLKYSDVIITVSPILKDLYENYAHKMFTAPLGVDTSVFYPKEINIKLKQEYDGQHFLLYVGRLSAEKGLEHLFTALKKVVSLIPDTKLLIIGEGNYRKQLENAVKDLNLNKHVYFLGFKNKDEIVEYLSIADVFVLPSLSEYMPNSILEAMACGVPVIATNVGGIPYIIKDDITGNLVKPNNPDDLAKSIVALLKNEPKSKEMANNALIEVKRSHATEICA
ncbi:MAG: glycosyltransferase family 4 protein, partial [Promethearchaeota archaeon]